jgi:hypothetical protein
MKNLDKFIEAGSLLGIFISVWLAIFVLSVVLIKLIVGVPIK